MGMSWPQRRLVENTKAGTLKKFKGFHLEIANKKMEWTAWPSTPSNNIVFFLQQWRPLQACYGLR